VTGIPLPIPAVLDNLSSGVDSHLPYLDKCGEILQDAVSELGGHEVKDAYDEVKGTLEGLSADSKQVDVISRRLKMWTQESYESIKKLLISLEGEKEPAHDWKPKNTGLVCVTSRLNGHVAWVSPIAEELFHTEGEGAFTVPVPVPL
jgi:hypothetical protein